MMKIFEILYGLGINLWCKYFIFSIESKNMHTDQIYTKALVYSVFGSLGSVGFGKLIR